MSVLALDLSINSTGWAYDLQTYGCLSPDTSLPRYDRIEHNLQEILCLADKYKPDLIAIEDIAGSPAGRNKSVAQVLCEQQGIIKYHLRKIGYPISMVSISSIKKFYTGKGNATKKEVIQALKEHTGVSTASDDEADALTLLCYALKQEALPTID